jgi:adenylate cyclase
MTIRKKTFLVLLALTAVLVCTLWAILSHVVARGFNAVEMRDARLNMERVREAFAFQQEDVCARVLDWAHWDDTWVYAQDRNQAYFDSNLKDIAFEGMNLDLVVIADSERKIVSAVGRSRPGDTRTRPIEQTVLEANFAPSSPLLALQKDANAEVRGLVLTPMKPALLVCAIPIAKSDGSGEIRGTLVMGRFFDEERRAQFAKTVRLEVSFAHDYSAGFDKLAKVLAALPAPDSIDVRPESEKLLIGHTRFADIEGKRNVVARVELSRDIHAQAITSMRTLIIVIVLFGVAFAGAMVLLIEKLVIRRLAGMSAKLSSLTAAFDFEGRVDMSGKDEISKLGRSVNGLLAACEQAMFMVSNEDAGAPTKREGE